MSVTFEIGQQIRQRANGRIWEITGRAPNDPFERGPRWTLVIYQLGTRDERRFGETTHASQSWIDRNCDDWPPKVDPPCGDGRQTVAIIATDGDTINIATFDTAAAALAYISEELADEDTARAEWWGWEPEGAEPCDLSVTLKDGALVWKETV